MVKGYFSLDRVLAGIFELAQTLYGIRITPQSETPVWHPEVRAYDVVDEDNRFIARFYLDLHPRSNKYSHAACFGLRSGRQLEDGYQKPEAALVCNFPAPAEDKPSLLTHREVETLFHESGHLMHHLLTRASIAGFSGTSVSQDFVEMPSQIFENWVWEKEALKRFGVHYQTGETVPDALIEKMLATRHMNSGIDTQQQLFYATLDMSYHDGFLPEDAEATTRMLHKIQAEYTLFNTVEGTHMQASFGHLIGYSAAYYGYLWSRVYADDMFSVFKENGIFDGDTGRRFRDQVLARGDSEDPMVLIENFLGRKPGMDAFLANLGI